MTASPQELRLMLLDGAIRFAEKGREGLVRADYEMVYDGIARCQSILMELINALRPEHDSEVCKRLSGLYTFLYTRLMEASRVKDPAIVEDVIRLLQYERETWSMLVQKLADENAAARGLSELPQATPPIPPTPPAPRPV